jgi:hypothetical protein
MIRSTDNAQILYVLFMTANHFRWYVHVKMIYRIYRIGYRIRYPRTLGTYLILRKIGKEYK